MKTRLFAFILAASSYSALATSFCPIDQKGEIKPLYGYEIGSVKQEKNKAIYTLVPDSKNPFGGGPLTWTAFKNKDGKIIKIESGGEKPSQKLVDFINGQFEEKRKDSHLINEKLDKPFQIPTKETVSDAIAKAEDHPIRFGRTLELSYVGNNCVVDKISDRYFDQKKKLVMHEDLFASAKCADIKKLYSKYQSDIASCNQKFAEHDSDLNKILNSYMLGKETTGVGGGGGSPIRSIASFNDLSSVGVNQLLKKDSDALARIEKENRLCDVLTEKPLEMKDGQPKGNSTSTKQ